MVTAEILSLLGGIGLFLFGMQTMSGALRQAAVRRLRAALARFTRTPLGGLVTGAATTAMVQSSSATIMTTIGFVGAGLLTFPQALGIVYGANIGTTVTGWVVAILGLKLKLGTLALPLLFAASLLAALGRGGRALAGQALVGFSLIFLGLDLMQTGTAAVEPLLDFAGTRDGAPGTILLLVLVGAVVTAIIQSSSAGVAATLVMLGDGTLGLAEAAALVIGMDVGTTLKSVLATIGGSRDMRRTALAHVGYNVVTAVVALLFVGWVPRLPGLLGIDATTALVAFHSAFNVAGAVLLLAFSRSFARLIERLVPGGAGPMPEPLDRRLLAEPAAALDAARSTAGRLSALLFADLADRLAGRGGTAPPPGFDHALADLEDFLVAFALPPDAAGLRARYTALLHLADHLDRLHHRAGQEERIAAIRGEPALRRPAAAFAAALRRAAAGPADAALADRLARLHRLLAGRTGRLRRSVLLREHAGLVAPGDVFAITDALRWLERSALHLERITRYAAAAAQEAPPASETARRAPGPPEPAPRGALPDAAPRR
ncbi:MAG: Na/Pi symporter [Rhodobacteraceae bacterium]|nr:Na/Pi symporter [Paracoccaceae bacterium]